MYGPFKLAHFGRQSPKPYPRWFIYGGAPLINAQEIMTDDDNEVQVAIDLLHESGARAIVVDQWSPWRQRTIYEL